MHDTSCSSQAFVKFTYRFTGMINTFKRTTFRLLATMILVSLMVATVAIFVIFSITLKHKKKYLKKLTDYEYATISKLIDQNMGRQEILQFLGEQKGMHPGLEESGEIILTGQSGDSIFLMPYRNVAGTLSPERLKINGELGKPEKYAASGGIGFIRGPDYRGVEVLAYCEYIPELEWGLVTKINFSEISSPFFEATLYAFITSLILVLVGTYFFKRISDPLYKRIMEREEKYHLVFEFIPSGITIANKKGEIIETNDESVKLLGLSRYEHALRKIDSKEWKIIRLDHSPMPPSEFPSTIALNENRLVTNVEMGIVKEGNKITWLNVSAAPFPHKDFGIIASYSDITRRVEAEHRLKEHDKKLEKYARDLKSLNDTKDKFFRILAHDLKNPFGSLLGASEYLYKEAEKHNPEKIKMLGKILYASAKSGYDILANLLEWSRSQTGLIQYSPTPVNLSAIIDSNISLVTALASSKNIAIETKVDPRLEVMADQNMINTVIRNLLTNALKFTHKGGRIKIHATKSDREVMVTVQDNGTGIRKEDMDKLFRIDVKYVNRGTDDEKGTGLGLILCHEFIKRHQGRLWAESKIHEGSKFHFTIPVSE